MLTGSGSTLSAFEPAESKIADIKWMLSLLNAAFVYRLLVDNCALAVKWSMSQRMSTP